MPMTTRVLIARGHLVTPWELLPWLELPERFEVRCLITRSNQYDLPRDLALIPARSLRDLLPGGRLGTLATSVLGDRYLSAREAFRWADIVHAEELSFWFAADAARRRRRGRFRLVQTIWETLPLLRTFRSHHAVRNRRSVLAATDLFLPTTERAAMALRLEGIENTRIRVCPPGIQTERFAVAATTPRSEPPGQHLLISPGRLVWEKGHQDVLRALALLHRGLGRTPHGSVMRPRLAIVGSGPEEERLRTYAAELGLADHVTISGVPYDEMPARLGAASALVLASLATATAGYHPFDIPHAFWEEQFGMVLAEAMAAGLDIISTTSGAIPEVLAGTHAQLVAPGDWPALATALATGPLCRAPAARVSYKPDIVERYSTTAAARRLADAYDAVLTL